MALVPADVVTVTEIILETPEDTATLVNGIDAETETFIEDRITKWRAVRDSHVRLTGETDFDNERTRAAIRMAVRTVLGLTPISPVDLSFESLQLVELEVGANFG